VRFSITASIEAAVASPLNRIVTVSPMHPHNVPINVPP